MRTDDLEPGDRDPLPVEVCELAREPAVHCAIELRQFRSQSDLIGEQGLVIAHFERGYGVPGFQPTVVQTIDQLSDAQGARPLGASAKGNPLRQALLSCEPDG